VSSSQSSSSTPLASPIYAARGFAAPQLIHAYASPMRQLAKDLVNDSGLMLGDFDVLAQLGRSGGSMRIGELAVQALSSRSGMTRRIDRLVDEGGPRAPQATPTGAALWLG
jgi:hypothetical protein